MLRVRARTSTSAGAGPDEREVLRCEEDEEAEPLSPRREVKYDHVDKRNRFMLWRRYVLVVDARQSSIFSIKVDAVTGAIVPPAKLIPLAQIVSVDRHGLKSCAFSIKVQVYHFDVGRSQTKSTHTYRFRAVTSLQAAEWVEVICKVLAKYRRRHSLGAPVQAGPGSALLSPRTPRTPMLSPGSPPSPLSPPPPPPPPVPTISSVGSPLSPRQRRLTEPGTAAPPPPKPLKPRRFSAAEYAPPDATRTQQLASAEDGQDGYTGARWRGSSASSSSEQHQHEPEIHVVLGNGEDCGGIFVEDEDELELETKEDDEDAEAAREGSKPDAGSKKEEERAAAAGGGRSWPLSMVLS